MGIDQPTNLRNAMHENAWSYVNDLVCVAHFILAVKIFIDRPETEQVYLIK